MASGPDAGHFQWPRMPQWDSARRLRAGDMIHPDSYGVVNGYIFDMVRSKVVGGEPTASQRRLIQGAADCVHAIIAEMRPGVTCGQLHAAGQRSLREAGLTQETPLGNAFPAFGHHDGLGFESPWIVGEGSDADEQIRAPAVLSIEAEVTDGVEAAGCEEMVLVLPDSVEVLTSDLPIFA
jgi:Xaa-Pro aminopeptidase